MVRLSLVDVQGVEYSCELFGLRRLAFTLGACLVPGLTR